MLHWILILVHMAWAGPEPFWRSKEKVYDRIKNREVIISVKSVEQDGPLKNHLKILGGGHVAAPREFVFRQTRNYEAVMRSSSYVRSAQFDPALKHLNFEIGAFGYTGHFKVQIDEFPDSEPQKIGYRVLGGPMDGLKGIFDFRDIGKGRTEVGIDGDFHYDTFPMARLFLEFGMEVVFQRMAINIRSHVEDKFKTIGKIK